LSRTEPGLSWFDGTDGFYVIGYVDYRDTFSQRHRVGFARRYQHGPDRIWLFETAPGYNYDIETDERGNPKS
jgi:hypothetical protein